MAALAALAAQAEREAYAEAKDRATRTAVKMATEVSRGSRARAMGRWGDSTCGPYGIVIYDGWYYIDLYSVYIYI